MGTSETVTLVSPTNLFLIFNVSFILSTVTEVGFGSFAKTRGIINVQINVVPAIQRLPVLGSTEPFAEVREQQNQVSLTRYGGGPLYDVKATQTCVDANKIRFKFLPKGCDPVDISIQDEFFVSSYNFDKQINQFGTETWGLIDKPVITFSQGGQFGSQNKVMPRGIAQGQTTPGINTGVILSPTGQSQGVTAGINAGNPGVGRADIVTLGVVTRVGGSTTSKGSQDGRAQVTIPYQVIDI